MRFGAFEHEKRGEKSLQTPPTAKKNQRNELQERSGAKQSNIPLLNEFVISSLEQDTEECSPLACQPNGFRNAERFALFFSGNFQTKSDAKLLEF
jgi:hypothetical protein